MARMDKTEDIDQEIAVLEAMRKALTNLIEECSGKGL